MKNKVLIHSVAITFMLASVISPSYVIAQEEATTNSVTSLSTETVTQTTITEESSEAVSADTSSEAPIITSEETTEELTAVEEKAVNPLAIYRLYNPSTGKHLYTTDENEKNVLYNQRGWGYEGVGWYSPSTGIPVYRIYNPILQNHLYTQDEHEVRVLTSQHGWQSDNGGNPVFYSGGSVNVYRLYNRGLQGRHHWTTDINEYKVLPNHGWSQEDIKFKALKVGSPIQTQYKENLQANKRKYSTPITKNEFGRTIITIKTQSDLETFLDDDLITERDYIEFRNTKDLVFPQRVYQVTKWADWYITPQSTGDIDFNNSIFLIDSPTGMSIRTTGNHSQADGSNQVFKNMIVVGSANAVIEETDTVITMKKTTGHFNLSAVKASNMTFQNMKFYAAHAMSSHLFDIMGSSNIIFDGIQSYGYGTPGMTEKMLVKLNKDNAHRIYSEAIQIDAAYPGGAGEVPSIKQEWNRQIWSPDMFDGTGSHDILVTNSLFTNYTGPTGHSIMAGTNEVSTYTYGATIGSHGMDAKIAPHYRNITVQNSRFDSTIYNPVSKEKVNYPIHFLLYKLTKEEVASLKSVNNIFTNLRGTNYSNNGVAGTTAKWTGDSYLSFYAGEPIKKPQ